MTLQDKSIDFAEEENRDEKRKRFNVWKKGRERVEIVVKCA